MSPRLLHWSILSAALAAAVAVGFFISSTPPEPLPTTRGSADSSRDGQKRMAPSAAHEEGGDRAPALDAAGLRAEVFMLVNEPDRLTRIRRLCDLLAQVNGENWREVLDGFERQPRYPAGSLEWQLFHTRIGEVAGGTIARTMALPERDRGLAPKLNLVMEGWAAADPEAARAWFDGETSHTQAKVRNSLILGMARTDPAAALRLAATQKAEWISQTFEPLVRQAIALGGAGAAEELLRVPLDAPVENQTRAYLFHHIARIKALDLTAPDEVPEYLAFLDRYADLDNAGRRTVPVMVETAARHNPAAALNWVQERADTLVARQQVLAIRSAVEANVEADPTRAWAWFQSLPASGFQQQASVVMIHRLQREGRQDQARQMIERLTDPRIREEFKIQELLKC